MAQSSSLLQPDKKLRFTEKYFPGFWVQLTTLVRRNEHADDLIDGILTHPMLEVLAIHQTPGHAHAAHAEAIRLLYLAKNLGSPIGQYPTAEQLETNPIRGIRDFAIATTSGTNGGINPGTNRHWVVSGRWARTIHARNIIYRNACKHIWETIVATFSSAEAVTVIAGLPYGSGMKLLSQVKSMQQRQTTMALFTLFSQLISMQLKSGEKIAGLYGRILEIRARLENWDPPIVLPDQLLIVCMLRMLPRQFHATRTIIMSRDNLSFKGSKDMLLDVENQDAERVANAVGSKPAVRATALLTNTETTKRKKKKKKRPNPRSDPRKSDKYHSEGACPHHGKRCGHAGSECYTLHPHLRPTAAVANEAEALAATSTQVALTGEAKPFGFLNEDWGYALVVSGEEVNTAGDSQYAFVQKQRRGVHGVGKHKRCSTTPLDPKFPHSSLRPDTEGRLMPLQPKGRAKIVVERVAKVMNVEGLTCYPGGVQLGADVQAKDMSRLQVYDSKHDIVRGLKSVGDGLILVVKKANADRDLSLLDDCDSQLDVCGLRISVRPVRPSPLHNERESSYSKNDTVETKTGLQRECESLIEWLVTTASIQHWDITRTIKELDNTIAKTYLLASIREGARTDIWLWLRQQCDQLKDNESCVLHTALTNKYVEGMAYATNKPQARIGMHICADMHVTRSVITTAALDLLGIPDNEARMTLDTCILPNKHKLEISLPGTAFDVIKSTVPYAMFAGMEALMIDCRTRNMLKECDNAKGYALMMRGEDNEHGYAVNDQRDTARMNELEARMRDAEDLLDALTPEHRGPAPMKFRAAKNLQTIIREERHSRSSSSVRGSNVKCDTHAAASCAKKKGKPKKPKRYKGHGWSKKSKQRRSKSRSKNNAAAEAIDVTNEEQPPLPRASRLKPKLLLKREDARHYRDKSKPVNAKRALYRHRRNQRSKASTERAELRKYQEPALSYNPKYGTVGVQVTYDYEPGLCSRVTCKGRCPSGAFSPPLTPKAKLPLVMPVQVPDHFTLMIRVGDVAVPNKASLLIPGTQMVLQVVEVLGRAESLVTSTDNDDKDTILDSGATEHICPIVRGPLEPAPVSSIHGLSGKGTPVTGMGKVNSVHNVMCCPKSTRRLLSVARLLEQLGGKIMFTQHKAYHVVGGVTTPIAARNGKGLYKVTSESFQLNERNNRGTALVGNAISTDLARERITGLHRAFGHASIEALRTILKQHNFRGVSEEHLKLLQPCNACMLGKSHKIGKSRLTADKATAFGYRLCADCCGPFRTQSVGGAKYLLVVIDEYSSWTWGVPVKALTTVDEQLGRIIEVDMHQRDDTMVKVLRSDGGSEFVNQRVDALLQKHGIEREVTCPNTSYQNGKAERRIRTIFERVRTCLSDSGLPPSFWAEAAVYAVYTLNRTPVPRGTSPFFKRYGRHPRVAHMRPFGNPCVIYRERTIAGKIRDAGVPGTMLGYGYVHGKNGTRVRVGNTNKVTTFRDVRCGVYPSASARVELLTDERGDTPEEQTPQQRNVRRHGQVHDQVAEPREEHTTPDATLTNLDNMQEVEANQRENVLGNVFTPEQLGPNGNLDQPAVTRNQTTHTFNVGALVEGNWRGHGEYYDAMVTGVHKSGSRVTYDLRYDQDNEPEPGVSANAVRTRRAPGRSNSTGLCGHALVTDCNPAYIAHVDMAREHITPKHYGQVMSSKDKRFWLDAMKVELKTIKDQKVYEYTATLPNGVKALGSLWVFKVKCGPDGKVSRYKARLTVNGKTQVYGINYSETFAPVAFATTIRLVLALAVMGNMTLRQFDIKCAFLYAELPEHERVYMRTPPGYGKKGYWHLRKSLYGLCQSPRLFNKHLDNTLRKLGWVSCTFDPCLYRHVQSKAFLVVVVDDMILASPSEAFTKSFYKQMRAVYDLKDLGVPTYVIGVRVTLQSTSLKLLQDRYISDLHEKHVPGDKATNTPAIPSETLCLSGIHGQEESPLLSNPKEYRSLVGGLMYTLITRPDVAAAVSTCARYLAKPRQAHLDAAKRILRYLFHTRLVPLVYNKFDAASLRITVFADSSWANDVDTRRSRYGFAIYLGKSLVSWRSKLHSCVALSTAEAEYCAATEAAKQTKWIASLVAFLKPSAKLPPALLYEDNDACRTMVQCQQISGRNKHFELKQHFVRELYRKKVIQLLRIPTDRQIADIFTKPLARPAFEKHRSFLFNGISLQLISGAAIEGGC